MKKTNKIKQWIRFSIFLTLLIPVYLFLSTFFHAFLNTSKTVVVNINVIGEANIEFVLLLCLIPMWIYLFLDTIKKSYVKLGVCKS